MKEPVVSCALGRLYNKEALIEYLISRKVKGRAAGTAGDADIVAGHIKGIKDVVTLNLTVNPAYTAWSTSNNNNTTTSTSTSVSLSTSNLTTPQHAILSNNSKISQPITPAHWICPISLKEMTGIYRFSFIQNCGCVVSEEALRNVKSTDACMVCGAAFGERDGAVIVPINSTDEEEIKGLKSRMEARKKMGQAVGDATDISTCNNNNKKNKNKKKRKAIETISQEMDDQEDQDILQEGVSKRYATSASANINMALPSALLQKIHSGSAGRGSTSKSAAIASLYAAKDKDKNETKLGKGNYLTMGTFTRYASF